MDVLNQEIDALPVAASYLVEAIQQCGESYIVRIAVQASWDYTPYRAGLQSCPI